MVRRLTTRTRPDRSSPPLLHRELSDRRALPFALAEEARDAGSQAPHQRLRAVRLAAAGQRPGDVWAEPRPQHLQQAG
eukprot:scaffold59457_cov61-Phaeocystis_antarctica.AAC.2